MADSLWVPIVNHGSMQLVSRYDLSMQLQSAHYITDMVLTCFVIRWFGLHLFTMYHYQSRLSRISLD